MHLSQVGSVLISVGINITVVYLFRIAERVNVVVGRDAGQVDDASDLKIDVTLQIEYHCNFAPSGGFKLQKALPSSWAVPMADRITPQLP